jgi:hypothetical protein
MITTERANVNVPVDALNRAREEWPEVQGMSVAKTLRFALVLALTGDRKAAFAASQDARIGTKRT